MMKQTKALLFYVFICFICDAAILCYQKMLEELQYNKLSFVFGVMPHLRDAS